MDIFCFYFGSALKLIWIEILNLQNLNLSTIWFIWAINGFWAGIPISDWKQCSQ